VILHGHDSIVCDWYANKLGMRVIPAHSAIGFLDIDGSLRGAMILQMDNDYTATVHLYSELPQLSTFARGGFAWMFSHAYRINAQCRTQDKAMKRHLPRLGFKFEGRHKDWFGPGRDVLSFYMTADQCRWIRDNGQHTGRAETA